MPVVPPGFLVYFGRSVELGVQDATLPSGATKPVDGDGNPVSVLLAPHPGGPGEQIAVYDKPPLAGGVEVVGVFQPYEAATDSYAGTPVQRPPVDADGVPVRCLVPDTYPALYDAAGHAINPWPKVTANDGTLSDSVAFIFQDATGTWVDVDGAVLTARPNAKVVVARLEVAGTSEPTWLLPKDTVHLVVAGPIPIPDDGNPPPPSGPAAPDVSVTVGQPAADISATVDWVAGFDGGSPYTGWQVRVGDFIYPTAVAATARTFPVTGLKPNTQYKRSLGTAVSVRGVTAGGEGAWGYADDFTTPAWTPAPDPGGTTSPTPMGLPNKVVAMFYMSWTNSPTPSVTTIPTKVNMIEIAFFQGLKIVDVGQEGSWENYATRMKAHRAAGRRIVISTGGESGAINYADRTGIVNAFKNIRNSIGGGFGIDGWGIDAEGPAVDGRGSDGKFHIVAITEMLQDEFGPKFFCSMTPPGGPPVDHYLPVAKALHQGAPAFGGGRAGMLGTFGQQFYDTVLGSDNASSIAAIRQRVGQYQAAGVPPNHVYLGWQGSSIARRGAAYGQTVSQMSAYWDGVKASFPTLRGAYFWHLGASEAAGFGTTVADKILAS